MWPRQLHALRPVAFIYKTNVILTPLLYTKGPEHDFCIHNPCNIQTAALRPRGCNPVRTRKKPLKRRVSVSETCCESGVPESRENVEAIFAYPLFFQYFFEKLNIARER